MCEVMAANLIMHAWIHGHSLDDIMMIHVKIEIHILV